MGRATVVRVVDGRLLVGGFAGSASTLYVRCCRAQEGKGGLVWCYLR